MLDYKAMVGTGESFCRIPEAIRVRLNNTEITHEKMRNWVALMEEYSKEHLPNPMPHFDVWWGRQGTKRSWGHCYPLRREIVLNRKSVEVFLHELAHAITHYCYNEACSHGPQFGQVLDWLIRYWLVKEENATK